MASQPPDGDPAPRDGALPPDRLAALGERPFGVYVHVPFCSTRCGYCDFNTYTAGELGPGSSRSSYLDAVLAEVRLARRVLGPAVPPATTVFFGGGTPTLLAPDELGRLLDAVATTFGIADDAEVSVEANPDSVDGAALQALRRNGFTRVSFGMQSASRHVLQVLDRTHTPGGALRAVADARAAGFDHVNIDLIYGTPGETEQDWRDSLQAAASSGADHVSAYALVVEDGTRMAARVRRGELPAPDDDEAAARYLVAEEVLSGSGMRWYEVSNWAKPGGECRHNLGYWRGDDWWGLGPGAHSHVRGVRWWNVRHPTAYAARLADGSSPAQAREVLDSQDRWVEDVLLRVRLAEGVALDALGPRASVVTARAAADGLAEVDAWRQGRLVLTLRGRLLADAVVRDLVA
ncbi:MAG: coproporphyrinogen III oxidase [Actinomycetota bacterium]|nr:MAG: coproporphyrinogen III oxidase [Actinomycetota bacterium]